MIRVKSESRLITLDKPHLLASGGEGAVYSDPGDPAQALKIYHAVDPARTRKLQAFLRTQCQLPETIVVPQELLHDERGRTVVGFSMSKLEPGYSGIGFLAKKSFCNQHRITTRDKIEFLIGVYQDIVAIHAQGAQREPWAYGDINDRNILFNPNRKGTGSLPRLLRALIDIDTVQFWEGAKPYLCMAATEAFLSPDLYRVDLSRKPMFRPEHDWFSMAIHIFRTLMRQHPFKAGAHPDYPSALSRAEHGITFLDEGVDEYPPEAYPRAMLTEHLGEALLMTLARKKKGVFPLETLLEYREVLRECQACGFSYPGTTSNCPECDAKSAVRQRLIARIPGLEQEFLILTKGNILHFQRMGETLYVLADEQGQLALYEKRGRRTAVRKELGTAEAGVQYGFFDDMLVLCPDPLAETPEILIIDISGTDPQPVDQKTTARLAGDKAIFGCSERFLYHIAGNMIMCTQKRRDVGVLVSRPVTQVLENQTWFTVAPNPGDQELLFGVQRVFTDLHWFLIAGDDSGAHFSRYAVDLPVLRKGESLLDIAVFFSASSVLVVRKTRYRGVEWVYLNVLRIKDGTVRSSKVLKVEDAKLYEIVHGKAFNDVSMKKAKGAHPEVVRVVLHPTDRGIVQEVLDWEHEREFTATTKYVSPMDQVYDVGGGELLVVKDDCVLSLKVTK